MLSFFSSSAVSWLGRVLGLWVWLGLLAGCGSPPKSTVSLPVAKLVVRNLTNYEWTVTATPAAGGRALVTAVGRRQTVELSMGRGDYQLEQMALPEGDQAKLTRNQRVTLEAGETYDWVLMTLLSEP